MTSAQSTPRAYESLIVGEELASVEIEIPARDAAALRDLLGLAAEPRLGGLPVVHLAFLRAVLAAGVVPDGAIMTRLTSRHQTRLVPGERLRTRITIAAKEVKRGRSTATLRYAISAAEAPIAVVDQTVIWPST